MILTKILEAKQASIKEAKQNLPFDALKAKCSKAMAKKRDFKYAISKKAYINIIGELKKASPSRGILKDNFDPVEIAKTYQLNGASALSVLTEEKYFLGSISYINKIKKSSTLPVLRKDFIIDEYQIYESCYYGADAILLIADILTAEQIKAFKKIAASLNMDSLIEAHTEEDLEKIINADAEIIGINNRDLHTFKLNLKTGQNLISMAPKKKIIVIESGIKSNSDIIFFKSLGASAFLIGEAFMEADDIGLKVRQLMGKQ